MSVPTLSSSSTSTGLAVLPRVNLLPPEIGERVRLRRLRYAIGGGVLAALGVLGLLYLSASSSETKAQRGLQADRAQGALLQRQVGELSGVSGVYSQVAGREAMLQQAMGQEVQWSHFLNDLSLTIPDHVWVTSMTISQTSLTTGTAAPQAAATDAGLGTVTFAGTAFHYGDVAAWLEALSRQKGYSDPYFTKSAETVVGARRLVTFDSSVTLTRDALSGRYTKSTGASK